MQERSVIVTGGMSCVQSVGCAFRGFEKIGCRTRYLTAIEKKQDRKKGLREAIKDELVAALEAGVDAVFWWQAQTESPYDFIMDMKDRYPRTKWVGQSIDDPHMIDQYEWGQPNAGIPAFDLMVTCCESSMETYAERGVQTMLGYPPCDADLHGKAAFTPTLACDASLVCTNLYPKATYPKVLVERADMLEAVAEIVGTENVHLYGYWGSKRFDYKRLGGKWRPSFKGWIGEADEPDVYASSTVNLSTHVRPDGYKYLTERDVICTASGGLMLVDHVAGIEQCFEPSKEVFVWSDLEHLKDLVRFCLKNPGLRETVARAGRERSLADYSNTRLARRMLEAVGL